MNEHTCKYCDGTLQSTRPPCMNCGHVLCLEVTYETNQYIDGQGVSNKTMTCTSVCPKCQGINKYDGSNGVVMEITL